MIHSHISTSKSLITRCENVKQTRFYIHHSFIRSCVAEATKYKGIHVMETKL